MIVEYCYYRRHFYKKVTIFRNESVLKPQYLLSELDYKLTLRNIFYFPIAFLCFLHEYRSSAKNVPVRFPNILVWMKPTVTTIPTLEKYFVNPTTVSTIPYKIW